MLLTILSGLYLQAVTVLSPEESTELVSLLSPDTGDLDFMILAAAVLIAAFSVFILVKNRKNKWN